MKRLPRIICAILLLSVTSLGWATCPEGQQENDRTGQCQPIPGWKKSSKETSAKTIKLDSYDIESTLPSTALKWKNNPIKVGATWSFPSEGKQPFPLVIYLLSSGGTGAVTMGNGLNGSTVKALPFYGSINTPREV